MSRCNKCVVDCMRQNAESHGFALTVLAAERDRWPGAVNVFVHPPGTPAGALTTPDDNNEGGNHWAAWFMALPERCECG